jgi:hypothetical protein
VKKPGVISQSASFPARGPSGATKAATTPKLAKKPEGKAAAVANGSGPAGGYILFVQTFSFPSMVMRWCQFCCIVGGTERTACRPRGGEEGEFCSDACCSSVDVKGKALSWSDLLLKISHLFVPPLVVV